jgi:hypothetical protein
MFGYLALPNFFGAAELELIDEEYERGLTATDEIYAEPIGVRGQRNWSTMRSDMPFLARALEHPRLLGAAQDLLGEDALGVMANGNCFSGNFTEWHSDTSVEHFRSAKFVAYLDPVGRDSGALRVIPGSHLSPWHEQLRPIGAKADLKSAGNPDDDRRPGSSMSLTDVPAQICESKPGDVFAFDLRTWHASWNGSPRRRMCSFTYFGHPLDADEEEAVRQVANQLRRESMLRELRRQRGWMRRSVPADQIIQPRPQYSPAWLANEDDDKNRARWISSLRKFGFIRAG